MKFLFTLAFLLIFVPVPAPPPVALDQILLSPSLTHLLGTDQLGRDQLMMLGIATLCSVQLSLIAAFMASFIATWIGLSAALIKGPYQSFWMRLAELIMSLPYLPIAIVWQSLTHGHMLSLIFLFTLLNWASLSRILHNQSLETLRAPYIQASKSMGSGVRHLILAHLVPDNLKLIKSGFVLIFSQILMLEAILSFLGLGQQSPRLSLGQLIHQAQDLAFTHPGPLIYPGIVLMFLVFVANRINAAFAH